MPLLDNILQIQYASTVFFAPAFILFLLLFAYYFHRKANRQINQLKQQLISSQAEVKIATDKLVQAEKLASLGQLTAGVAHEINNPVTFIGTSIEALKYDFRDLQLLLDKIMSLEKNQNEPSQLNDLIGFRDELNTSMLRREMNELIASIERGAYRTSQIVRALRTFSRDTDKNFTATDIHHSIESALTILQHKLKNRVEIHRHYEALSPVDALPGKLNQVFLNILDNASQAIKNHGDIHISTQMKDGGVLVQFKDNGTGMCDEVKNRIFEPFFTTKGVGKGTGLGLSISLKIIEQHKGSVQVESILGSGSTLTIWLPLRAKPAN